MSLKQATEKINQVLEAVCVAFLIALFALLLGQVLARFAEIPTMSWTDETIQFFLAWFVFLGSAVLVYKADHIGVDLLREKLGGTGRKALGVFVLLCILAVGGFLVYGGGNLVLQMAGKRSPVLGLPQALWYLSIPTSGTLIVLFAITKLAEGIKLRS